MAMKQLPSEGAGTDIALLTSNKIQLHLSAVALFCILGTAKQSGGHPKCQFRSDKPWLNLQHHQDETIKKPEELESEMKDPPDPIDSGILDRIHGSMIGMTLGDALGAFVEFRPHEYMVANPVHTLKGGGTWGLEKGQFTDDTSMALCLANSLIVQRDFVPYDQLVRYKWWHQKGYMSSTGSCFDIGTATKQSLQEFERRQKEFAKKYKIPFQEIDFLSDPALLDKFDVNCSEDGVAGNGPLMRLAPVPLFFYLHPVDAVEYSGRSGMITHGDKKAYDACRYYGALIVAAVNGASRDELFDKHFYENHKTWFGNKSLHSEIMNIAHGSYKKEGGYDKGIRGKGYIVSALEAALWAFWSDKGSYENGVLAAVNLGDDTDTTAAIYGQLAGAHYGYRNLPEKWGGEVYAKNFIKCLSKWIVYEGKRWALKQSTIPTVTVESPSKVGGASPFKETNSNMQLRPTKDQRYRSKSFGNNQTIPITSTLMSEQSGDPKSDYGLRRYIVQDKTFTLQPNSHEQHALHRPGSAENLNPTSLSRRVYIHKDLKYVNDVYRQIVLLGDEYVTYANTLQKHDVDGYWLLNYIKDEELTKYGVENKTHRQVILDKIEQLKNECPK